MVYIALSHCTITIMYLLLNSFKSTLSISVSIKFLQLKFGNSLIELSSSLQMKCAYGLKIIKSDITFYTAL